MAQKMALDMASCMLMEYVISHTDTAMRLPRAPFPPDSTFCIAVTFQPASIRNTFGSAPKPITMRIAIKKCDKPVASEAVPPS